MVRLGVAARPACSHPPGQKRDLGGVVGAVDRGPVGGRGFVDAAEASEEVGPNRVEEVVPLERQGIDQPEHRCSATDGST